jgi:hypothetical protein
MTDEQRCHTCRFWLNREGGQRRIILPQWYGKELEPNLGVCALTIQGADYELHSPFKDRDSLAYAVDCEDYWAALVTRAEFGCVQWEART